ncbi:MAG: class I SAM-dependent methyltransferase [Gammaproteobacteria bacterium]|nr:MAG: class I SAM-dependent methyltransferase [Gammaproteobacteria bacterium]
MPLDSRGNTIVWEPELDSMRERYEGRSRRYDPWVPWVYMTRQELERKVIRLLARAGQLPPAERRVLEVGCGSGANLRFFLNLGFEARNLLGCELLNSRVAAALAALPPAVTIIEGNAASIDLPDASFDIVFQSLVFSSILHDELQMAVARRMWELVRPGGGILWYDFVYNNPSNPGVRGVSLRRVRELFPGPLRYARWVTLAPPISRLATRMHPIMYTLLNGFAPLRTHRLCWIPKS